MTHIFRYLFLLLIPFVLNSCVSKKSYNELSQVKEITEQVLAKKVEEVKQLKNTLDENQAEFNYYNSELNQLTNELSFFKQENANLVERIKSLQDLLRAKLIQIQDTTTEINTVYTKIEDLRDLYVDLPPFYLPPLPYSKELILKEDWITNASKYKDISDKIESALLEANYLEAGEKRYGYFKTLNEKGYISGFALVTSLEQTNEKGQFLPEKRWEQNVAKRQSNSLWDWLIPRKLEKGYFRLFAFIVTEGNFWKSKGEISRNLAISEYGDGPTRLPGGINELTITDDTQVIVLVYEFDQKESERDGQLIELKAPTGKPVSVENHLIDAGILKLLKD